MGTIVTLKYSIDPDGPGQAAIQTAMAKAVVPVPSATLEMFGLRVTSDSTTVGASPVVRTIVLSFVPTATATATAALVPGDPTGSPVDKVSVTGPGDTYIRPPIVRFAGGNPNREATAEATLEAVTPVVNAGGGGYDPTTFAVAIGAMAPPSQGANGSFTVPSCVQDFVIGNKGARYDVTATLEFVGGLGPGGVPAQGKLTIVAGKITAVTLTNPGAGYIRAPKMVVNDPIGHGSGAKIAAQMGAGTPALVTPTVAFGVVTALVINTPGSGYLGVPRIAVIDPTGVGAGADVAVTMGVGAIQIVDRGFGYRAVPTVTLVPLFKSFYPDPDLVEQAKPFWALMETQLGLATISPVHSDPPVVT